MLTATISDTTWTGVRESRVTQLRVRPFSLPRTQGAFLAAEIAALAAILSVYPYFHGAAGMAILIACCEFLFHVNTLDRSIAVSKPSEFLTDVTGSIGMGSAAAGLIFLLIPSLAPGLIAGAAAILGAALLPALARPVMRWLVARGQLVEGVLIAGNGELAAKLHRALTTGDAPAKDRPISISDTMADRGIAVEFAAVPQVVVQERVSRVIVAEHDGESRSKLADALLEQRIRGLEVDDAVEFYEEHTGKIWVENVNPEWFIYTNGFACSRTAKFLERCFDVAFAGLLVLLTAPLLALIAIAIKLDSKGPVIFRQSRTGLNGKPFVIYKFRSMRVDAESKTGPMWSVVRDGRVTRIGGLLRKFRLDELLQAFNVLQGDMSIVGPRPERPCFVDQLDRQIPFYSLRHSVRPGITGWAQVMYPYGASVEDAHEKLQYDLYYVKHKSMRCNTWILLKTLKVVLFGGGR